MYVVLTTCPPYGSRNVGDQLIEQRLKRIIAREKGVDEFLTIFREEPLEPRLAEINASRAILMPGFAIRDTPMYPNTYRLVGDLDRLRVPMVPVGANWNVYPGDAQSRFDVWFSKPTTDFLHRVAQQTANVSCREIFVCDVLRKHGVRNTLMTGDPAMFCLPKLGTPMRRPARIDKLVFSPPLSPYYAEQADSMLTMLAEMFPAATRWCAFHLADADGASGGRIENSAAMSPQAAEKNRRIRRRARELGYELLDLAGRVEALSAYDDCDLHVGYECHAHLYFLSVRAPSVLIAEDARGVGFNHALGVGGFDGFVRRRTSGLVAPKTHTSGYCTSEDELAIASPRDDVHHDVGQFLRQALAVRFGDFAPVAAWLDETYERAMTPFIRAIP